MRPRVTAAVLVALATTLASGLPSASAVPTHVAPRLRVIVEPTATMHFLDAAIAGARHSVLVEMYELSDPVVEDALVVRYRHHVDVEVLLDKDYDAGSVNAPAYALLRHDHVAVRWADPGVIFHEKAVVVDGATAYVGTGNLTSEYYANTRDFWVVDTQRADVAAIAGVFHADWAGGAPGAGAKGVDLIWSPGAKATVLSLINGASHSISLESEELESEAVVDALAAAARRHVAVHVTMTYDSSYVWAYKELVSAGAKVHLFHGETPIYIHAKALCIDCTSGPHGHGTMLVGSQNLSTTSLEYNRELSILTTAPSTVQPILAVLGKDFSNASPYSG